MLAHQDKDGWGNLELCDPVRLDDPEHLFKDECGHDVDRDVESCGHEHSVELAVGVIEGEEADPALVCGWVYASSFELGFLDVLDEDGLFRVGDEVVVGLANLIRGVSTMAWILFRPTIMTPLGRPVVPLE